MLCGFGVIGDPDPILNPNKSFISFGFVIFITLLMLCR